MAAWTWIWIAAIPLALAALVVGAFRWLYVKVPAHLAFVRTGLGGRKAVADAGAFVLPFVHNLQWLSLETVKIEVVRADKEAFITKDRYRVDIGAEFYVKIPPDEPMLEAASRSLGEKSFSADAIQKLLDEKLVSAIRTAAATADLVALHENRRGFALQVKELVGEPLAQNGLIVEDVAVFMLDQTDVGQLDPNNIFDAEGLRQITAQTSARRRERNEIERSTEVEVKKQDVEAVRRKLSLEREQAFAEAEQQREVEMHRVEQRAQAERFRFEQEQQVRETEITRDRRVREAELARELYLVEKRRDHDLAEIERERALEEARRAKEIAVLQQERRRVAEEESRLRAEAEREAAAQAITTAAEQATAERAKHVALIRALEEVEVAEQRIRAAEARARARVAEGEAEARAVESLHRAHNTLEDRLVLRDVALALIARAPEIARELMEPARHIDSIRVLDLGGRGARAGEGSAGDPIARVWEAVLGAGAALPLLRELLAFADSSGLVERLEQAIAGLRSAVELRRGDKPPV
jgi:uncharacterized membrane protein YqiK